MEERIFIIKQAELESLRSSLQEIKTLLLEAKAKSIPNDGRVDPKTAAGLLNITTRTLSTWRAKGVIKASRVGRKIYYKVSDINNLIERNRMN